MLYPVIAVPGRVNGGLHEMFTVVKLRNEEFKSPTEPNLPTTFYIHGQVKVNFKNLVI